MTDARPKTRSESLPAAAMAVSAILWGLWWMPLRWLASFGLDGPTMNAALYGVLMLVLLPLVWHRRRALRANGAGLLITGAVFAIAITSWNTGIVIGEVVRVTLLFYLAPVWASLVGHFFLGQRLTPVRIAAIAIGLGGAAILLGGGTSLPVPSSAGEWLGLLGGVFFALSLVAAHRLPEPTANDYTIVTTLCAAVLTFAVLPFFGEPEALAMNWEVLRATALVAVFGLLPITWIFFWGCRAIEPGRASLILLLEVAVTAISAALLAGEPFGWPEAIGCLMIAGAGALEGLLALIRRASLKCASHQAGPVD